MLPSTDCQFVAEINDQPSQREILTNNDENLKDLKGNGDKDNKIKAIRGILSNNNKKSQRY